MLREDAHSAQGYMVAEATAPRRENVPRHILFYNIAVAFLYYTRTDVRFAKEIFLSGFLFFSNSPSER